MAHRDEETMEAKANGGKEWSGPRTTLDAGGTRRTWNTFSLESDEVHTCSHLDLSVVLFEGTKFVMLWK